MLAQEKASNEEPGQDEEDVDADESARRSRDLGVEQEDGEDGDASQALELGAKDSAVRAGHRSP
jgi:hypothetical protein